MVSVVRCVCGVFVVYVLCGVCGMRHVCGGVACVCCVWFDVCMVCVV